MTVDVMKSELKVALERSSATRRRLRAEVQRVMTLESPIMKE
jgi:hypothetical protein